MIKWVPWESSLVMTDVNPAWENEADSLINPFTSETRKDFLGRHFPTGGKNNNNLV